MTLDGRYRAVLDRIEADADGRRDDAENEEADVGDALILIEDDLGEDVLAERTVDLDRLPAGVEEGAVMTATFEDDALRHLVFEPAETERRRGAVAERFDRLSERPPGSSDSSEEE